MLTIASNNFDTRKKGYAIITWPRAFIEVTGDYGRQERLMAGRKRPGAAEEWNSQFDETEWDDGERDLDTEPLEHKWIRPGKANSPTKFGFKATNNSLAIGSVESHHIVDGAIKTHHIDDRAVTSDKLATKSIGAEHLQSDLRILPYLADGSIQLAKLSPEVQAMIESGGGTDSEYDNLVVGETLHVGNALTHLTEGATANAMPLHLYNGITQRYETGGNQVAINSYLAMANTGPFSGVVLAGQQIIRDQNGADNQLNSKYELVLSQGTDSSTRTMTTVISADLVDGIQFMIDASINGNLTIGSGLNVTGGMTVGSGLIVTGGMAVGSGLSVTGAFSAQTAVFQGGSVGVVITGTQMFGISNGVTQLVRVNSTGSVTVANNFTVGGDLYVTGTAIVNGLLGITGTLVAGGGLYVPPSEILDLHDAKLVMHTNGVTSGGPPVFELSAGCIGDEGYVVFSAVADATNNLVESLRIGGLLVNASVPVVCDQGVTASDVSVTNGISWIEGNVAVVSGPNAVAASATSGAVVFSAPGIFGGTNPSTGVFANTNVGGFMALMPQINMLVSLGNTYPVSYQLPNNIRGEHLIKVDVYTDTAVTLTLPPVDNTDYWQIGDTYRFMIEGPTNTGCIVSVFGSGNSVADYFNPGSLLSAYTLSWTNSTRFGEIGMVAQRRRSGDIYWHVVATNDLS